MFARFIHKFRKSVIIIFIAETCLKCRGDYLVNKAVNILKKFIWVLCVQFMAGCLLIYIADKLFAMYDYNIYVGINPVTAVVSGVLGIPGVASLFAIANILK